MFLEVHPTVGLGDSQSLEQEVILPGPSPSSEKQNMVAV